MAESVTEVQSRLAAQLPLGKRVRIRHRIRIGTRSWTAETSGTVREISPISTGIHTDRVPNDDIWVASLLIEKPDGELSRVAIDQETQIEPLPD